MQSVPFLILFSVILKIDLVKDPVFWFPLLNNVGILKKEGQNTAHAEQQHY